MFAEIRWAVTHVLRSPARLQFLFADGIRFPCDLLAFLRRVVPLAAAELADIESIAQRIPDDALRGEALASVQKKAYHVAGGCILATFLPADLAQRYVAIVAPLETIYDYLDNLCDRHPGVDPQAYPVLHQAIADALDPDAQPRAYYAAGPFVDGEPADDGGYLSELVRRTQRALRATAGYQALLPFFAEAARLYAEMQTFKHFSPVAREAACVAWYERSNQPEISWYEFACAAGSQFQVYAPLYMMLAFGDANTLQATYRAYFPAVSALHVLLDAFIDQEEDRLHGELNFVTCFPSFDVMRDRMHALATQSYRDFTELPDPYHHRFLVRVMALFYLTHPKVFTQHLDERAIELLRCF